MNTQTSNPSAFPTFHRVGSFLRSPRTWRVVLFLLVLAVTLVALIYAEENWRGNRAWNKYRREAAARGDVLDLAALVPPQVPDAENFAAIPTVKSWFPRGDANGWEDMISKAGSRTSPQQSWKGQRHMTDFVAWEQALAAEKVKSKDNKRIEQKDRTLSEQAAAAPASLKELDAFEPVFAEFRAAAARPKARYPVEYLMDEPYAILLPHLAGIKGLVVKLGHRACAHLAVGNSDRALDDVLLILRLGESLRDEPFLISQLVRIACFNIAMQPVWEGMMTHRWSDGQLAAIDAKIAEINFPADIPRSFKLERAAGIATIESSRRKRNLFNELGEPTPQRRTIKTLFWHLIPSGWYSLEALNFCRMIDAEISVTSKQPLDPAEAKRVTDAVTKHLGTNGTTLKSSDFVPATGLSQIWRHEFAATLLLPALGNAVNRFATAQTVADQARTACALERYRIAHRAYPSTLAQLVPEYLKQEPYDLFAGKPMKYKGESDSFVLYSVGADGKDDGGTPGKALFDKEHGDLIWRCAPLK